VAVCIFTSAELQSFEEWGFPARASDFSRALGTGYTRTVLGLFDYNPEEMTYTDIGYETVMGGGTVLYDRALSVMTDDLVCM
jgi:hypothetical protein